MTQTKIQTKKFLAGTIEEMTRKKKKIFLETHTRQRARALNKQFRIVLTIKIKVVINLSNKADRLQLYFLTNKLPKTINNKHPLISNLI